MNNDLENLYNNTNSNNNLNNTLEKPQYNNSIMSQPNNLSDFYGENPVNPDEQEHSDNIGINQEGISKMYNQNNTDLETEPVSSNKGPTIINKEEPVNNINLTQERVSEANLLEAYVGKNYERIASKPFNFAAFFFNIRYLFFRKKVIYAVIFTALEVFLSAYINFFLLEFGLALVIGSLFNTIYLKDAKKDIQRIREKNPTRTMIEIRDICKKKGGRSIIFVILGSVLETVVALITIILISLLGISLKVSRIDFTELIKSVSSNYQGTYTGMLIADTAINIEDEYEIEIPATFEKGIFNSNYEYQYEMNSKESTLCNMSLYKVTLFNDAKDLARQMSKFYLKKDKTEDIKINNIYWHWFTTDDGITTKYYYIANKEEKVYIFDYESSSDNNECLENKDIILNSIIEK